MGGAQGLVTISNGVGDIILNLGIKMPTVGAIMGAYVRDLVQSQLTLNYGTEWVFGILLAFGGFILVARGDRKPRNPRDKEPLLSEPLYAKQE